jgi:hypothetical protein
MDLRTLVASILASQVETQTQYMRWWPEMN